MCQHRTEIAKPKSGVDEPVLPNSELTPLWIQACGKQVHKGKERIQNKQAKNRGSSGMVSWESRLKGSFIVECINTSVNLHVYQVGFVQQGKKLDAQRCVSITDAFC